MSAEEVIDNLESAINRVCNDIKIKKGGSGADKLESLSKLVNSYSRLIGKNYRIEHDMINDEDETDVERLTDRRKTAKAVVIR